MALRFADADAPFSSSLSSLASSPQEVFWWVKLTIGERLDLVHRFCPTPNADVKATALTLPWKARAPGVPKERLIGDDFNLPGR